MWWIQPLTLHGGNSTFAGRCNECLLRRSPHRVHINVYRCTEMHTSNNYVDLLTNPYSLAGNAGLRTASLSCPWKCLFYISLACPALCFTKPPPGEREEEVLLPGITKATLFSVDLSRGLFLPSPQYPGSTRCGGSESAQQSSQSPVRKPVSMLGVTGAGVDLRVEGTFSA